MLLIVVLSRELVPPAAAMVGTLVAFVLVGILPVEAAFAGLSSPATISIAGLFVVARALRDHAQLDRLVGRLLGDGATGPRGSLVRFVPPVVVLSGFTNNTPLVAAAAPVIRSWAHMQGVAATKLLMPLSFAAIIGGTLTVIGTGPNLVVSGMLQAAGEPALAMFSLTPVGLPLAVVGAVVLIVLAPRVLPDRRTPHEQVAAHERDYAVRVMVVTGGPLDGVSIADGGLRDLPDAYVASVVRDGVSVPAAPQTVVHGGDELIVVGGVASVPDLLRRPGLVEAEHAQTGSLEDARGLVECIVGQSSALIGKTLKQVSFRGRYGAAVIALHRASERVEGKLGAVELRPGDTLLLLTEPAFVERWADHRDFAVVIDHHDGGAESNSIHRWVTIATFVLMITAAGIGVVDVLIAILIACSVLVASRAISFARAIDALDLDVLLIVAAAIGLGAGVQASGLAGVLSDAVVAVTVGMGAVAALAAVVLATMVLTEVVTNVAAAALMAPIALNVAGRVDADPTGFAVAVALGASASFVTPIGYQTNTIVYGLGGYRFADYWRLGLPMAVATLAVIVGVVPVVWG